MPLIDRRFPGRERRSLAARTARLAVAVQTADLHSVIGSMVGMVLGQRIQRVTGTTGSIVGSDASTVFLRIIAATSAVQPVWCEAPRPRPVSA